MFKSNAIFITTRTTELITLSCLKSGGRSPLQYVYALRNGKAENVIRAIVLSIYLCGGKLNPAKFTVDLKTDIVVFR